MPRGSAWFGGTVTDPTKGPEGPALGTLQRPFTGPGGAPGQYFQGMRQGQFGFPKAEQIPENIGPIRELLRDYSNRPTGFQFTPEQQQFRNRWEGVMLRPDAEPFDFNLGSRVASFGEPSGQGGWQPAQAEASPMWEDMYA